MNNKNLIIVLIVVVVITFSVGMFSFRYNDKDNFVGINGNGIINIQSDNEIINVGSNGIEINDGKDHVSIGWDGINVSDGDESVSIGWKGINVTEGGKTKFNFGKQGNFLSFGSRKLKSHSIDEEKFIDADNIKNINLSSPFIDIKVTSEDRKDIRIHYYGNMKSNVLPELKIETLSNKINIKLETPNNNSNVTANSSVVLEVFLPQSYKGNITGFSSSANISMKNLLAKDFDISSSSGNLLLEDLKADYFKLSTSSGNIIWEDSTGKVDVNTSSGDVTLDNILNNNDIQVLTSSGNVGIILLKDANYKIRGSSSSGRYISNIDMDIIENEKGRFNATIGSGKNSIDINTSSGNIKFNKN